MIVNSLSEDTRPIEVIYNYYKSFHTFFRFVNGIIKMVLRLQSNINNVIFQCRKLYNLRRE